MNGICFGLLLDGCSSGMSTATQPPSEVPGCPLMATSTVWAPPRCVPPTRCVLSGDGAWQTSRVEMWDPLKSQVIQLKGAGGLVAFCEQTRHLPGSDKLEESVLRAAMWLGYLPHGFPHKKGHFWFISYMDLYATACCPSSVLPSLDYRISPMKRQGQPYLWPRSVVFRDKAAVARKCWIIHNKNIGKKPQTCYTGEEKKAAIRMESNFLLQRLFP